MKEFNIRRFKDALLRFKALKAEHPSYNYKEWKMDSTDMECLARRCTEILEDIKATLADVRVEWGMADVNIYVCRGAGYFPKIPWIGLLFRGEKPTDGVYPALGLYEGGMAVGCVESFSRPQGDFWKRCFTPQEIDDAQKASSPSAQYATVYMSRSTRWLAFADMDALTAEDVEKAVRGAIDEYRAWRKEEDAKMPAEVGKAEDALADESEKAAWYRTERVVDVPDWISKVLRKAVGANGFPWVFRGQGNAGWGLETGLQRSLSRFLGDSVSSKDIENLLGYERETLQTFRREVFRRVECRSFEGVDLLALMQHYGGKTRLLDFSFSPLVALYFAQEQNDGLSADETGKRPDVAVWAVDLSKITPPDENVVNRLRAANGLGALKRRGWGTAWWEFLELSHEEADAIVDSKMSHDVPRGVGVLVSSVNNERSSAQEGLFLMPKRMSEGFETNLRQSIQDFSQGDGGKAVVKYVFPSDRIGEVKESLARFRITSRQIFADLEGIAKVGDPETYFTWGETGGC